jgi:protease I
MDNLNGIRVAILIDDGFEQVEMTGPRNALVQAGAEPLIVSARNEVVRAWKFTNWGDEFPVQLSLGQAQPERFDALLLPGGVINADALRIRDHAVEFVKAFFDDRKPVAVICHGPWIIIDSGAARGRRITSWPSLKTDLTNAGATWLDREVVVDGNLVSSRKPDDIPAFNREMIELYRTQRVIRESA